MKLKYRIKDSRFNSLMLLIIPIILIYNSCIQLYYFNENSLFSISKNLLLSIGVVISCISCIIFYERKDIGEFCALGAVIILIYAVIIIALIGLLISYFV